LGGFENERLYPKEKNTKICGRKRKDAEKGRGSPRGDPRNDSDFSWVTYWGLSLHGECLWYLHSDKEEAQVTKIGASALKRGEGSHLPSGDWGDIDMEKCNVHKDGEMW